MNTTCLLDRIDAARLLGISVRRLMQMVRDGSIPYVRLPGVEEPRFLADDLADWLRSLRQEGSQ